MNRELMLNYIWDSQILPQMGYSFSDIHSTSYSLIGLCEMNIAHLYPSSIWDAACLTVSAAANNEDSKKSQNTDYAAVASSIGKMKKRGVKVSLPSINSSNYSFYPDIENNQVFYGFKGIVSMNQETIHNIILNRPYSSFEDFYDRLYKTGILQTNHMVQLIKSGSFNEFSDPISIMTEFLKREVAVKTTLSLSNLKRSVEYKIIDSAEFNKELTLFDFNSYIKKLKKTTVTKPKNTLYELPSVDLDFFLKNYTDKCIVESANDHYIISGNQYDKEYKNHMLTIKEWLSTPEAANKFNTAQFLELWNKYADGTPAKWEMESVSFYSNEHELDVVDKEIYGIDDFFELSTEPVPVSTYMWKGQERHNYQTFTLVGTVLDKNKDKHTFTLLTPTGVVTCKTYTGAFANYDKKISKMVNGKKETVEKSWFSRGNLLMVRGFRRDDQFILKSYGNQETRQSTVSLITNIYTDGTINLKNKRDRV